MTFRIKDTGFIHDRVNIIFCQKGWFLGSTRIPFWTPIFQVSYKKKPSISASKGYCSRPTALPYFCIYEIVHSIPFLFVIIISAAFNTCCRIQHAGLPFRLIHISFGLFNFRMKVCANSFRGILQQLVVPKYHKILAPV